MLQIPEYKYTSQMPCSHSKNEVKWENISLDSNPRKCYIIFLDPITHVFANSHPNWVKQSLKDMKFYALCKKWLSDEGKIFI